MKKFDESKHPRDKEGKFTNKNTSSSSVATKEKESNEYTEKVKKYKERTKCNFNLERIQQLKSNPNIVVLNHDISLKKFINQSLNDKSYSKKLVIAPISKKAVELVKKDLDIDLSNLEIGIDADAIRHIFSGHGNENEYKRGQITITKDNFNLIMECINNPTDVAIGRNNSIFFIKKDKENVLKITSLTYTQLKKQSLMIKTAYFHKLKEK